MAKITIPRRTVVLRVVVSEQEAEVIRRGAEILGRTVSGFARETLLAVADQAGQYRAGAERLGMTVSGFVRHAAGLLVRATHQVNKPDHTQGGR